MSALSDIVVSLLLVAGGLFTLIGSLGLFRMRDFYTRLHGPTKATTLGVGCLLVASSVYFSVTSDSWSLHEVLVSLFLFITAPISAHLMIKAALHRGLPSLAKVPEAPVVAATQAVSDAVKRETNFSLSQNRPFWSAWLRRLAVALAGVVAVWLLGWVAVPPLLKSQLQSRLSAQLGRVVTVGAVDFKPWSLELTLHDVAVAHAGVPDPARDSAAMPPTAAKLPQLAFKRLYIDMELQSLLRLAPVVDALALDALTLNLTHTGDGHYDIDDVLAKFAAQPEQPDASVLRYALYNLVLSDTAVTFNDAPRGQIHHLKQINLSVPFVSNFDSKREVLVSPKLRFELNGSVFDSSANSTPFAHTRQTDAQLRFKDMDLAPYLAYLPATLPVRVQTAVIDADLQLSFTQEPQTRVTLSGQIAASRVRVDALDHGAAHSATAGGPLLAFERLAVALDSVQPLAQQVDLRRVELVAPQLWVTRDRAGVLNLLALGRHQSNSAAAAQPWQIRVQEMALSKGQLHWLDQVPTQPVHETLSDMTLQAHTLTWPFTQPMPFEASAQLASTQLSAKGQATDHMADVSLRFSGLPLKLAAPYLAEVVIPRLDGQLGAEMDLKWTAAQNGKVGQTLVHLARLDLDKLRLLGKQSPPLASIDQLQLHDVALDLGRQSALVQRLQIVRPQLDLRRTANGRWMFQDWLKASPSVGTRFNTQALDKPAAQPTWALQLKQLQVDGARVNVADDAVSPAVALEVSGLAVQVRDFVSDGKRPFGVTLAARLRHGHTEPGSLNWRGSMALNPLTLKGDLAATKLPLQALASYASDMLNVSVLRADASFKGRVSLAQGASGMTVGVTGDAALEDLQAQTRAQAEPVRAAEELLNWKSLALTGLDVALAPGAAPRVNVAGTVLSDFYARVILDEAGRLNLQDIIRAAPVASQSTTPVPAPKIHFGPVSLVAGHVNFTDRFIKPNYSADLTELVGKLSAFSSEPVNGALELADLELRGRAQGTATLDVLGKINPLVQPVALDITGRVRDLELAPLSTYSARYAGYGIERGKLSVDVAYKVQPDGQLTANNKLVLNQLKFGDKVPNASNSLPVKLAVALLADRNGVIDLDLPISGSLNDPQFRLLPIIFKIIGNVIVKAITAPFSLLANALGGGGDELSMVSFEAGSAALTDAAKAGLTKVAKALQDRPALKMTVLGSASLEVERDAYKRVQLQALVAAEQRRAAARVPTEQSALPVASAQYPTLLRAVYKRADFPKPRNLIGMTKDIPVPDMEALLLSHLDATEAAMQALAVQRGVAVRDYLASLKVPMDRLFLGASKAVSPEAKWRPRAELNLATE